MPLSRTLLADLERIVGAGGLVRSYEGRLVYESDMHTFYKGAPDVVALPTRTDLAVASRGCFVAPEPSRQMVTATGGNVSTNAGGPHCLKYGITTSHVLGLELVTGTGEAVRLGGKVVDRPGYDLTGIAVGSEGTFGIVTAVTVRLLHAPEAVRTILASFVAIEDASEAVSAIIAAGMIPAALEMLDEMMIRAINEGSKAGYPKDAAGVPLRGLDGALAGGTGHEQ